MRREPGPTTTKPPTETVGGFVRAAALGGRGDHSPPVSFSRRACSASSEASEPSTGAAGSEL